MRRDFLFALLIAFSPAAFTNIGVSAASASHTVALVGNFKLTAGVCNPATGAVTGSYFKLIFPGGNVHTGFFSRTPARPVSTSPYTTISPGTQGGLSTGEFQPGPHRRIHEGRRRPCQRHHPTGVRLQLSLFRSRPNRPIPRPRNRPAPDVREQRRKAVREYRKQSRQRGRRSTSIKDPPSREGPPRPYAACLRHLQRADACIHAQLDEQDRRGSIHRLYRPVAPGRKVRRCRLEATNRLRPTTSVGRPWRPGGSVREIWCSES